MVAVDHREANSHGFGLGAFDDWEEFAVAAGAPDDFLRAHLFFSVGRCWRLSNLSPWLDGWLRSRTKKSERLIDSGDGGGARVRLNNICVQSSKLYDAIMYSDHSFCEILPRLGLFVQ